ncbi:hypothetical protein A0J61_05462 [Choanephora cucurbitarum]|uniref:Uncharacterized protein n=1 Tax=Choanephora cucurbitarum TaxID=101091 RepID=A0A1C7NGI4_9FUNG|nr:hypothetical protein A0J61_05462 [Choanephora cucurbitarum]
MPRQEATLRETKQRKEKVEESSRGQTEAIVTDNNLKSLQITPALSGTSEDCRPSFNTASAKSDVADTGNELTLMQQAYEH